MQKTAPDVKMESPIGKKVETITTLQQQVKAACEVSGMSLTELGEKMGMSQQNFSKRLKVGKFTKEELAQMAKYLDADFHFYFEFENGTKVY